MRYFLFIIPAVLLTLVAARPAERTTPPEIPADVATLLSKYSCSSCHALSKKLVGPMWTDVAAKKYSKKRITALVYKPEPANWPGYPPMTAQPTVPKGDLGKIADWIISLQK
jgi:cytochrome c